MDRTCSFPLFDEHFFSSDPIGKSAPEGREDELQNRVERADQAAKEDRDEETRVVAGPGHFNHGHLVHTDCDCFILVAQGFGNKPDAAKPGDGGSGFISDIFYYGTGLAADL